MSETKGITEFLGEQKTRFLKVDKGSLLDFEQECLFARQQILKQEFTLKVAEKNPQSLQAAILNVAAIGISLNPAQAHAYLVPRDGGICLDISYKGLVYLATDCGALLDCKSILVYANDTFTWCGPYEMPKHEADVFSADRGAVVGAYNIAYLPDGRVMVDTMSMADIVKVQNTSKAGKGPWKTWWEEMAKKTMTKRAYKSWPQTDNRERLDKSVQVLHETEGLAYTEEQRAEYTRLIRAGDGMGLFLYTQELPESAIEAIHNMYPYGEKTYYTLEARKLRDEGNHRLIDIALEAGNMLAADDMEGFAEYRADFTDAQWELVAGRMSAEHRGLLDTAVSTGG